jgi:hypothetical protein
MQNWHKQHPVSSRVKFNEPVTVHACIYCSFSIQLYLLHIFYKRHSASNVSYFYFMLFTSLVYKNLIELQYNISKGMVIFWRSPSFSKVFFHLWTSLCSHLHIVFCSISSLEQCCPHRFFSKDQTGDSLKVWVQNCRVFCHNKHFQKLRNM